MTLHVVILIAIQEQRRVTSRGSSACRMSVADGRDVKMDLSNAQTRLAIHLIAMACAGPPPSFIAALPRASSVGPTNFSTLIP